MRTLAACSLGGAGHLGPLLPFLAASHERGDDVLVAGPPALEDRQLATEIAGMQSADEVLWELGGANRS